MADPHSDDILARLNALQDRVAHQGAELARYRRRRRARRFFPILALGLLVALVLSAALVCATPAARASGIITVTSTADLLANDGQCTLREATIAANTDTASGTLPGECPAGSGADTIVLQAGTTYTLTIRGIAPDPSPTEGDLDIYAALSIEVAGGGAATIDGNGATTFDRVLDIKDAAVTLTGVTIRGGSALQGINEELAGGGIRVTGSGALTLLDCVVSGNGAPLSAGGGIASFSSGALTITRSVISGNTALYEAGFASSGGPLTISRSAIVGNTATKSTGAFAIGRGSLSMVDSTVSGNSAPVIPGILTAGAGPHTISASTISGNTGGGGEAVDYINSGGNGIYNYGTLTVINSTISGNIGPAGQLGTAIDQYEGNLTLINVTIADNSSGIRGLGGKIILRNSIVANRAPELNCFGQVFEAAGNGYNLDSGLSCGFKPGNWSLPNTDPRLYPLGSYGGPTQTHAQRPDSPTRDQIPAAQCPPPVAPATGSADQRGVARPQGATCDIGAVENGPADAGVVTVTTSGDGTVSPGSGGHAGTTAFTATPSSGSLFLGWTVDGRFVGFGNPLSLPVTRDRSVAAAFAPRPAFADVPAGSTAEEAIAQLAARGIIKGYGDGTFGPADGVLRAQMAALIARAMGWDGEDHGNAFPDQGQVDAELWRNVGTLAHYGVARGYADGSYDPAGDVLYAQAISFITRAMVAKGYWNLQVDDPALYPDVPAGSGHRADIATFVHYAGALPEFSDVTAPFATWDQPATRAWFARALWQAYGSYFAVNHLP